MTIQKLGKDAYKYFTIDSSQRIRYTNTNYRSKGILVFSASWCGHCQALAPVLLRLNAFAQGSIPIVTIDPDQDQVMQKMFVESGLPINGFPTIYMMDVDGRVLHDAYSGPRTLEGLYMKTQTTQSCQETCGTKNDVTGSAILGHKSQWKPTQSLWADTPGISGLADFDRSKTQSQKLYTIL